jgi:hypothetical protein
MKVQTHTNRNGTVSTYTELRNGNIQWNGDFEFCRVGYPNDYTRAWTYFKKEYGGLEYEDFVEEVFRFNELTSEYVFPDVVPLIVSDEKTIDMIDPSGGPYMTIGDTIMGKEIIEFECNKEGYLIITK